MAALAQTLNMTGRNARLRVQSGSTTATLDFHLGVIRHAVVEGPAIDIKGDDAALEALGMQSGVFEILVLPDSVPHTVFADTPGLMLRAVTRSDEIAEQVKAAAALATSAQRSADAPTVDVWLKSDE
jgi:hypothetical protein